MISWIVEQFVLSAALLLGFVAFFKNETLHQWNRAYLLSTILISCCLPFLPQAWSGFSPDAFGIELPTLHITSTSNSGVNTSQAFNWTILISSVWTIGGLLYLLLSSRAIWQLRSIISRSESSSSNQVLFLSDISSPFSFLTKIYLPKEHGYTQEELNHILTHEKAHIQMGHTWDKMIMHLMGVILWWNPFYYLYRAFLKDVHEFQADEMVIDHNDPQQYSRMLCHFATANTSHSLVHSIFQQPLKKRIMMIKRKIQATTNRTKYLLLLPIFLLTLSIHSCNQESTNAPASEIEESVNQATQKEEVLKVAEEMPRFPGCEDLTGDERKNCSNKNLLNFIYKEVQYPSAAKKDGIEGTVISQFVVSKDGQVYDLEILKDPGSGLGEEVLRVLKKMSADLIWVPGQHQGKAVNVAFTLPVKFKLD